ncbi:type II toxin-antitoxin system RelE/ParE family toxin [Hoylesella timonensis]|uniref:Addiction module toxin RelE n=1 Tax=Hoylesella timonensis TaxID=386414 RepID=A0A2N6Q8S5_9BACT|nr:type II toxin-antitoxin system RelE/ParE family toxin [Hoylesella timonensis]PMC11399.1 addiction module toxin RelE [Hoylesella timonensis]
MKYRQVVAYKTYFDEFFKNQNDKVQKKIIKVLDIVEQIERIPQNYLKYIEGTNGLFEIRIGLGNNIFRIFCIFDGNQLVVLLSGFQKKTQKTPKYEIKRAVKIMNDYYNDKKEVTK